MVLRVTPILENYSDFFSLTTVFNQQLILKTDLMAAKGQQMCHTFALRLEQASG